LANGYYTEDIFTRSPVLRFRCGTLGCIKIPAQQPNGLSD